jgi:2-amino-4-hydroxy-6-hydroxymethyldihydropteridine diphosphokinase
MKDVYLLLGSNEGDREKNMAKAMKLIEQNCGQILKKSSLYQTEAWGLKAQSSFLNLAIIIDTELSPQPLLVALKAIEKDIGRTDTVKWGPRIIDIDILFYGHEIIDLPDLKVPHPFIPERRFTLEPLNDISSNFVHPVLNKTIGNLLENCGDISQVQKI